MEKQTAAVNPVVLIVDEDLSYLERMQRTLCDDFAVYTTTSGVEAMHLFKTLPEINVLIVSQELPRMKGTELLSFLHEISRDSSDIIKILLTEKSPDAGDIDQAGSGRIDHYFVKPVDPEKIRRKVSFLLAQKSREKRTSMRVTLSESSDIRIETGNSSEAHVVNISENGMFLRTLSFFPAGSSIPLKITLPDGRQYDVSGKIVRQDIELGGVGVQFQAIDEQSQHSILEFLSEYVPLRDLTELKLRYPFLRTDEMVLFSEPDKIESLMQEALEQKVEIVAIHAQSRKPEILALAGVDAPSACHLAGEDLNVKFKTSNLLFVSFQIGYATYNFETMVSRIAADGDSLVCLYPKVMFYSEKRAARRINPHGDLYVEISLPSPFEASIRGKISDISPEGVAFIADAECPALLAGTPLESLRIVEGDKLLWEEKGEVRNITRIGYDQNFRLRYGIQFGIGRMSIQSTQAPGLAIAISSGDASAHERPRPGPRGFIDLSELAHRPPDVIRLENHLGEEIVGLLNSSLPLDENPIPVIIIPPAFGKTKETLFGLALTIIQNFHIRGKPVAVIRYDGIRRKGESYKDPEASEPPYEMINATLSQGAEDIKAVLDWLKFNPRIKASSVTLVTFSLSALEARILLRDEAYRERVDYWIACLGTLEFRHLMNRVNCGLDLLEQYQIGIDLGVIPILGNLISMVPYASDVVASGVATLDQAREDMRHIDVPITWIYGEYDNWVDPIFVRDVMSIKADAAREVISMPIGHSARTSKEALRLFGLITTLVHRFQHKEMIQSGLPTKSDMEVMRRAENDRLPSRKLKNRVKYWRRYLIGEEDLLGFDVMALSDDYQQLMEDQLVALDLHAEDRLLDLGAGTGNFIEHLLISGRPVPSHTMIADLIPEAIRKADRKLSPLFDNLRQPRRFDLLCLDLELGHFLPVQRFLAGEIGRFVELADKVENLDLESAEKIQQAYSPRLHRILRGESISSDLDYWLKSRFDMIEYRVIIDFNQAAGYVRRLFEKKPEFRKLVFNGGLDTNLHFPFKPGCYNKILMSLVLSYIFNPVESLREVRRIIAPGGSLVLSSMRPDTDPSGLFIRMLDKIENMPPEELPPQWSKPLLLDSMRSFLNDAQALVDLEEAGTFDFFDQEKLNGLLEESGWECVRTIPSFGDPPQGYVVIAKPGDAHG